MTRTRGAPEPSAILRLTLPAFLWLAPRARLMRPLRRRLFAAERGLPAGAAAGDEAPHRGPLPRRVWLYWHQGESEAPPLVRQSIETWRIRNPSWDVRVLDAGTVQRFASTDDLPETLSLQARSDVIRLRLLQAHGGVWADATCWCARPLDDWIDAAAAQGIFAFRTSPKPDRIIDNWFLAGRPSDPLFGLWEALATFHVSGRYRPSVYFWPVYLFELVLLSNRRHRRRWRRVPGLEAAPCFKVSNALHAPGDRDRDREARAATAAGTPVHKLNFKKGRADADVGALLETLSAHPVE